MKNIIAVCDREVEYAHRLMDYMNHKNSFFMKAAAFSEEDSVIRYGEANEIDYLLISENMISEKTKTVKAKKKIMLMEEKRPEEYCGQNRVYKYQSAENIVREVMSSYEAENTAANDEEKWRGKKRIIGIYTPAGGTRKTSFALAMGQIIARHMPVLYMNLEGFSGLEEILGCSGAGNLGDLLYYAKHTGADPTAKLSMMTVTVQNLDIIPPVMCPEDLRDIGLSGWQGIFSSVLTKSVYEVLIIDIGNEVRDIAELLRYCTVVYMPVREDPLSEAKISDFEEYMKSRSVDLEKIKKVKIPFNSVSVLGKEYCENLIWSELGDYTRGLMQKEKIIG